MLREVVFPQARREKVDLQGRMGIDALQYIDEIDVGIDALEATRRQQTLNDPHMAGAHFCPTEQPVSDRQSLRKGKVYGPVIDGNFLCCLEGSTPSRERLTTTRKRVLHASWQQGA